MADFNERVTILETAPGQVRKNNQVLTSIEFAGSDPDEVRSFRAGTTTTVPVYRQVTVPNPRYAAWEAAVACGQAVRDDDGTSDDIRRWLAEYTACYTSRGFGGSGPIYEPPRTITETRQVGTRTVRSGAVNRRAVRNGDTAVYILRHISTDVLAGRWPRGTTFDWPTDVPTAHGASTFVNLQFRLAQDVDFAQVGKLKIDSSQWWCVIPVEAVVVDAARRRLAGRTETIPVPNNSAITNAEVRLGRSIWAFRDSEESEQVQDEAGTNMTQSFATFVVRYDPLLLQDTLLQSQIEDQDGRIWSLVGADRIDRRERIALRCERTV